MNTLSRLPLVIALAFLAGCASHPKDKPIHEEGWIGGRYKCAKPRATLGNWLFGGDHIIYCFPPPLEHTQKSGIFAAELGTNTPAYRAGLRAGDLILQFAGKPATNLAAFWNAVRAERPGESVPVKAWRDGQTAEYNVVIGREKFRYMGTVAVGLPGFWEGLHPIPTSEAPTFSLVALGWQGEDDSPVDFDSVRQHYRQSCHPKDKQQGDDQDWRCWLAIFQVSKGRTILGQESVNAPDATPHP